MRIGTAVWMTLGAMVPGAIADTLTLRPAADTTLFLASPGSNLGGSDTLAVGGTGHLQPGRGLLRFEAAKALPPGATVISARLEFTVTREPAGGGPASMFHARRVLRAWGEGKGAGNLGRAALAGEATWQSRFHPDTAWADPGGAVGTDFGPVHGQVSVAGLGRYTITSEGLAEDVRAWLADPATEFGWVLMSESEAVAATARRVATRENADSTSVPSLVIEYATGPAAVPPIGGWEIVDGRFRFRFPGEAGNAYEVQARDAWSATAPWVAITNFVVKLIPVTVVVTDPVPVAEGKGARFYRVADVGDVD